VRLFFWPDGRLTEGAKMKDAAIKFWLVLFWPVLAVVCMALIAFVFVIAWPCLPFAKVVRKADGKCSLKF
jgi:hypothetical protein